MSEIVHIICPNLRCKRLLAVPQSARGKTVRCKSCSTNVKVPAQRSKPATSKPASGTIDE